VLVDFPVVQYSGGLLPWVVSIWLDEPWKLVLWGVGAGLDLLLIVVLSGHRMVAQFQTRLTARSTDRKQRRATLDGRRGGPGRQTVVAGVSVDAEHLAERLGLFVIIVLGESVVQVVNAAAGTPYGFGVLAAGLASFVLLAGLFGLSVAFGHAGLPHLRAGRIPARAALGLHCLVTGVIATIAVSLASVVEHGSEPLSDQGRWLLCGALAGYFALGVATGVVSHASDLQRTISRIVTGVLIPILLAVFAASVSGLVLVVCLAVVVLSHLWFERRLAPIGQE
jgi:low temperature requirement protein LtrA